MSWLSAALSGRLTGSGAVFSGQQSDPLTDALKRAANAAAQAAKASAQQSAGSAIQAGVNAASPGAVVVTKQNQMLILGAALVVGYLLYRKKK